MTCVLDTECLGLAPWVKLYHGDCLEIMRGLPDCSVDSVVTDPPYGLSQHSTADVVACMTAWLAGQGYRPNKKGFMGRTWDSWVPGPEVWREAFRVLKPGGYVLAFAGTRTQDLMCMALRLAGFEIRDIIAWVYGSGYPKHQSCLKPALEPITLARKPAPRATLLNIDGCRVGDRYPANLIHDGSDEVVALFPDSAGSGGSVPNVKVTGYGGGIGQGSSGYLGGERTKVNAGSGSAARFFYCAKASRKDRDEGLDGFRLQTAGTGALRDGGRESEPRANIHPTVKPTDLLAYLCRLVTPPGGVVLDPFLGSGSTGKAAVREGFNFVGCELGSEYMEIAQARILAEVTK